MAEEEKKEEDDEEERKFQEHARQLRAYAEEFEPSSLKGDIRCEKAGYYGGFTLTDKEISGRLRSAGTEIVKMVGKKLFSG